MRTVIVFATTAFRTRRNANAGRASPSRLPEWVWLVLVLVLIPEAPPAKSMSANCEQPDFPKTPVWLRCPWLGPGLGLVVSRRQQRVDGAREKAREPEREEKNTHGHTLLPLRVAITGHPPGRLPSPL